MRPNIIARLDVAAVRRATTGIQRIASCDGLPVTLVPKTKPLSLRVTNVKSEGQPFAGMRSFVEAIRSVLVEVVLNSGSEAAHAHCGEDACCATDIG